MRTHKINDKHHPFAPPVIAPVVWLCVRFNLRSREVEELMVKRGMNVSCEAIRRWSVKLGPLIAHVLRRLQARPGDISQLDEVIVKIAGWSY